MLCPTFQFHWQLCIDAVPKIGAVQDCNCAIKHKKARVSSGLHREPCSCCLSLMARKLIETPLLYTWVTLQKYHVADEVFYLFMYLVHTAVERQVKKLT